MLSALGRAGNALQKFSAQHSEEKGYGQPDHETAGERLEWSEHPPFFRQKDVAVAERRVRHTGKIERCLSVGQTFLPPEKQRPDGNLDCVNKNKPPGNANQQPRDWPETCLGRHCAVQHIAQH